MSKPILKVTDYTTDILKSIDSLKKKQTLVGIPAEDAERKGDTPINNAALLYINEFGSPVQNIPARQPMRTGIMKASDAIVAEFAKCAEVGIWADPVDTNSYFERVGIIASNSVKLVINNQENMAPPAASTIKAREARGFRGTKALIVTGQMRNAITYVVKGE